MINFQPLVSICIPTFNGAQFIEEAMESAINQTYPNLEIVVSDDASKDYTLKIIESYKDKTDIPIHIFHHKPSGIGANWNHCIKKSKGDYIKFLFQDDILDKECITEMMLIAKSSLKIGLVYSKRRIIYEQENRFVKTWIGNFKSLHLNWSNPDLTNKMISGREMLKDSNLMAPPQNKIGEPTAVLLNKKVFEEVGYFNKKLKQSLDLEYWYRVMTKFDVGFVNKELVVFRLHGNQASQVNSNNSNDERQLLSLVLLNTIYRYTHDSSKKYILSKIKIYKKGNKLIRKFKSILWK